MTDHITMDHGSGGIASKNLINEIIIKHLGNPLLNKMEDAAVIDNQPGKIAFSTDSYVVDPLFFPGGDIGTLAVHGTINDLAMQGAQPRCLSLALILEEGLLLQDLEKIIISIKKCSNDCNIPIVTGDTKVVPHSMADKIFINTTGIGFIAEDCHISPTRAKPGDKVILSGKMGDHGITIMSKRAGINLDSTIKSDSRPLHRMISSVLAQEPMAVHSLRDPTRGGVATALNEIAESADVHIELVEEMIPLRKEVDAACGILGLDPFYLANEGKCLAIVDNKHCQQILEIMQQSKAGKNAAIIGTICQGQKKRVTLRTRVGGSRIIPPLSGEPLPRIC